ncbi:pyocin knob domain-containing protein [Limosilactobacillus oris]|uniref:pyocin knob domain-containing protein n=1 Tax=Limosilactobacillus oris TaxID=1632 RepID=UPI003AAE6D55
MKKMDLVPKSDNHQFKIDDTNTLLHYTATVNGEPQEFPSDDPCYFQIKTDKTFAQTAKATVSGSDIALSSKDLANLPVGNYELELWHMDKQTGNTDIFPDDGWLPFTINENALGNMGDKVTTITMKQMQDGLMDALRAQFDKFVADAQEKIQGIKPINGTNGASATIMVGDVKQLPANEKPYVKNVGTNLAAIFDIGIPVGAIKTEQLDTKNLNEVETSGYYTGNAMTIANAPSTGQFILKVVGQDDNCVQLYYDLQRGEQYMRTMYKGEWNPWRWATQWN